MEQHLSCTVNYGLANVLDRKFSWLLVTEVLELELRYSLVKVMHVM